MKLTEARIQTYSFLWVDAIYTYNNHMLIKIFDSRKLTKVILNTFFDEISLVIIRHIKGIVIQYGWKQSIQKHIIVQFQSNPK